MKLGCVAKIEKYAFECRLVSDELCWWFVNDDHLGWSKANAAQVSESCGSLRNPRSFL